MCDLLARIEQGREKLHVLVDHDGAVTSVARPDQAQTPALFVVWKLFLVVTRCDSLAIRHDPDLEKVHRLGLGGIELAVANPGTCGHDLHVARPDDRSGTDAVLML